MLSCPNAIEAQTGVVKIEKTRAKTMKAMINWIYLRGAENIDDVAVDLYHVACICKIALLQAECVKAMMKSSPKKDLLARLILAYTYHEEELKARILEYLREDSKNTQYLVMSQEWIAFTSEDIDLAKKIVADIDV